MKTETEFDAGISRQTIASYRRIAELRQEHGVTLVQQVRTGEVCVRKDLLIYDTAVYRQLQQHPVRGVPRIYALCENSREGAEAGEAEDGAPGTLTVIEEYIPGKTLEELLQEEGALPQERVTELVLQLCDVLEQLHTMDPPIVHRDIKPSNVMLKEDGSVVLIDFNAARRNEPGDRRDTRLIGTAGYAAPEQYGFASSTPRADLYAVGRLMCTLLTGNEESSAVLPRGISAGMRRIVNRCTQMNPGIAFHRLLPCGKPSDAAARCPADDGCRRSARPYSCWDWPARCGPFPALPSSRRKRRARRARRAPPSQAFTRGTRMTIWRSSAAAWPIITVQSIQSWPVRGAVQTASSPCIFQSSTVPSPQSRRKMQRGCSLYRIIRAGTMKPSGKARESHGRRCSGHSGCRTAIRCCRRTERCCAHWADSDSSCRDNTLTIRTEARPREVTQASTARMSKRETAPSFFFISGGESGGLRCGGGAA